MFLVPTTVSFHIFCKTDTLGREFGPCRVTVLPRGVNTERRHPFPSSSSGIVGSGDSWGLR